MRAGDEGLRKSRDHVPSKVLLRQPYPENLPVVEICSRCNSGFAKEEEYVAAFVSAVVWGRRSRGCNASRRAGRSWAVAGCSER